MQRQSPRKLPPTGIAPVDEEGPSQQLVQPRGSFSSSHDEGIGKELASLDDLDDHDVPDDTRGFQSSNGKLSVMKKTSAFLLGKKTSLVTMLSSRSAAKSAHASDVHAKKMHNLDHCGSGVDTGLLSTIAVLEQVMGGIDPNVPIGVDQHAYLLQLLNHAKVKAQHV